MSATLENLMRIVGLSLAEVALASRCSGTCGTLAISWMGASNKAALRVRFLHAATSTGVVV